MKQNKDKKRIKKIITVIIIILLLLQCSGKNKENENQQLNKNVDSNQFTEFKNSTEEKTVNKTKIKKIEEIKKEKIIEIKKNDFNLVTQNKKEIKINKNENNKKEININKKEKQKKVPKGFENIQEELYIKVIINKKSKGFVKAEINDNRIRFIETNLFEANNIEIKKEDKYNFSFKDKNFKYKYIEDKETLLISSLESFNEKKINKEKNNSYNIHQNLNVNLNKYEDYNYGLGGRLTINKNDYALKTLWYKKENDFYLNDLYLNKSFSSNDLKLGYFNMFSNSNYFNFDNRLLGVELNEKGAVVDFIDLFVDEESILKIYKEEELIYNKIIESGQNRIPYSELPYGVYDVKIEIDNGFEKEVIYKKIDNDINSGYSISLGLPIEKDNQILFDTKDDIQLKLSNNFKFNNIRINPEIIYNAQDKFIFSNSLNYSLNNYSLDLKYFKNKNNSGIGLYGYYTKNNFNISSSIDKIENNKINYRNYNIKGNYRIKSNSLIGFNISYKENYMDYIRNKYNEDIFLVPEEIKDIKKYSVYYRSNLYKKNNHNLNYKLSLSKNNIESLVGIQVNYYYGNIDNMFSINMDKEEEIDMIYSYNKIMNHEDGISNINIKNSNNGTNLSYFKSNYLGSYDISINNKNSETLYNLNYRTNLIYKEGDYAIGGNISLDSGIFILVDESLKEFYYSINNGEKIKVKNKNKIFISLIPNRNYTIQLYTTENNIGDEIKDEIRKVYLEKGQIEKLEWNLNKGYYLMTKLKLNNTYLKNKNLKYNGDIIFTDNNGLINLSIPEKTRNIIIDNFNCDIPKSEEKNVVFIETIECKENNNVKN